MQSTSTADIFAEMLDQVETLIAPYVEKDPTKFCTYEEFQTGVDTLREFCLLRAESVSGQLEGTIPAHLRRPGGGQRQPHRRLPHRYFGYGQHERRHGRRPGRL